MFLDKILGALLVGSYVNIICWTLEVVQVVRYFRRFKNDSVFVRGAVAGIMVVDSVSTAATCANVYLYCVTKWGNVEYLQAQYWPLSVIVMTTALSSLTLHAFLVERVWKLSKSFVVVGALLIVILTALGGAISTMVAVSLYRTIAQRSKLVTSATIWISTEAAADVAIAGTQVVFLLVRRKTVVNFSQSAMYSQLSKLTSVAIETGAVTSLYALVALAIFLAQPDSNVEVGLFTCLGRLYTLTMLYSLHLRSTPSDHLHQSSSNHQSGSQTTSMPLGFKSNESKIARLPVANPAQGSFGARPGSMNVRVHSTIVSQVDDHNGIIAVLLEREEVSTSPFAIGWVKVGGVGADRLLLFRGGTTSIRRKVRI